MAKIGLKYPVYKSATNKGIIGKALQADISIETNDAKLYGDDAVVESDKSFKSGKITLGVDDLGDTIQKDFLGHTVADGEIIANGNDENPYVGIGFYCPKMVNKVRKYRAIWLTKVQFGEPSDSNKTRGESIEFGTPTIEGTIMVDEYNNWKKEKTFATEAEAIAYLEAKAGITTICMKPVASLTTGTYTGTQSVTLTAGVGESIYYTTNGLTPSATNGTLYSTPISIVDDTMLRAIAIKDGSSNSEIANYEYIITV